MLPSLIAAVMIPLAGVATLIIERGSRRGRGLAGFLMLMGAADVCAFFMKTAPADGPPPHRAARMLIFFAFLAFAALVDFLADLSDRSGAARILGVPPRTAARIIRGL